MKLLVNGEVRELNIYDSNGIDWSNDLIGNNTDWSQYETDEDTELKIVDEEFFDWWSEYIENYTADEAEAENLARQFGIDISEIKEKIADNMADCTDMDMEHTIKQSVFDEIRTSAAAAALGRKGGSVKSEAKARAVRENGKKGGRPKMYNQTEMLKVVGVMTMEELDQIGHWNGEYYTVDGMTITPQYKQIGEDEFELTGYKIDK